jgi:hypothetical protein
MRPQPRREASLLPAILIAAAAVSFSLDARDALAAESKSLEPLVPEVASAPYSVSPGPRRFLKRICFSPGVGWLGGRRLYTFRLAYNPNPWLGYEATLAHNPGRSVQALFHTLNVVVRYPVPGRFQPYASAGYGMMHIFPGKSVNADPGTENTLAFGLGLEIYVRDDLAVRSELRDVTVLGGRRNEAGTDAYNYREATFGLAFYRRLGADPGD